MFFKKKKNSYSESVKILARQGYSEEYKAQLRKEIEETKNKHDKAEGMNYLASACLFSGQLREALKVFSETDVRYIPELLQPTFISNYQLCLFLLDMSDEEKKLYEEKNRILLREASLLMRRAVGIHEYFAGNFDVCVTVFIKLINDNEDDSRGTLMADICLVKSFIKLDMYEDAMKFTADFSRYKSRGELGKIIAQLQNEIFSHLDTKNKLKMAGKK